MLLIAMIGYNRPKEVESQGTVEAQFWFVAVTWPGKLDENWACKKNELICLYDGPPTHIVLIEDDGKEDIFQKKKNKYTSHPLRYMKYKFTCKYKKCVNIYLLRNQLRKN